VGINNKVIRFYKSAFEKVSACKRIQPQVKYFEDIEQHFNSNNE
jgi:hypothetical protein